jgi:ERCC4-related helicase
MGEFTNPVIVNCCKNMFCFDCLAVSMGELKNNKCPYCTQKITQADIHIFQNENIKSTKTSCSGSSNKYEEKDKLDVLMDLVQKKSDGSFMVFSEFQETFNKIEVELKKQNISYHILKGQATTVKKFVDDFRDKKVRILMLNAQFFGAGMNLQMATDIVIYHRFTKEMEEQIIGRAQRLGRDINSPLNVYYLLHENESSNIEDNFKFEDQKNIHYLDWLEQKEKQDNQNNQNNQEKEKNKPNTENNLSDTEKIYTINMENSDTCDYDDQNIYELDKNTQL